MTKPEEPRHLARLSAYDAEGNLVVHEELPLGVAIIGVIYFGATHSGLAGAFQLSLATLAIILVAVAVLTRLLPAQGSQS